MSLGTLSVSWLITHQRNRESSCCCALELPQLLHSSPALSRDSWGSSRIQHLPPNLLHPGMRASNRGQICPKPAALLSMLPSNQVHPGMDAKKQQEPTSAPNLCSLLPAPLRILLGLQSLHDHSQHFWVCAAQNCFLFLWKGQNNLLKEKERWLNLN